MREFIEVYPLSSYRAAFAPPWADSVCGLVLAAGESKRIAIPNGARFVSFAMESADGAFYAACGSSDVVAEALSGDVTDGSASLCVPAVRRLPENATHIAVVATADAKITLEFYA